MLISKKTENLIYRFYTMHFSLAFMFILFKSMHYVALYISDTANTIYKLGYLIVSNTNIYNSLYFW